MSHNLVIPKIAKVPITILKKLVKRFEESHKTGQTFTDHANWLLEKGCKTSKLEIHRFCQQLRELKAANPDTVDILQLYLDKIEREKRYL